MSNTEHLDQSQPLLPPSDAPGAAYGIIPRQPEDRARETPEGPEADHPQERWNEPRINAWRVLATYYSFIVVGANDGAYGVCIHVRLWRASANRFPGIDPLCMSNEDF